MTKPQDAVRTIIDETLGPRREAATALLVGARDDALPVARSDLHYVWDEYGNQYLDFAALMHPVGHRNTIVSAAVADHHRYYHYTAPLGHHLARWPVQYAIDLSAAFSVPSEAKQVLFCEGEREAVSVASRLARAGKPLAVLDTGWHDWVLGEHTVLIDPQSWLDVHWSGIGALLMAPVGTDALPIACARALILCARTAGVPVIMDESVTGFGRLGTLWGQECIGLISDLTVLGGPVGGGLPLGAVVASPDYFTDVDVSPQAGNPIACAAGASTLIALSLGVLSHVAESDAVFTEALDELVAQFPELVASHHGMGRFRGIRLRFPAGDFPSAARRSGLLVSAVGDTVLLAPPLVASGLELKRGVDLLADTLMSWDDESQP